MAARYFLVDDAAAVGRGAAQDLADVRWFGGEAGERADDGGVAGWFGR